MAWLSGGATNKALVENLCKNQLITKDTVRDAFLKVNRAHFSPQMPYEDSPQPIGHGATISAPHMHAMAVEALADYVLPAPGSADGASLPGRPRRVLDVGAGSGYLTLVLAELAGPGAVVVGVEHVRALRDLAQENVARSERGRALLAEGRVRFRVGDGRKGWVEPAPRGGDGGNGADDENKGDHDDDQGWDAIHVGASAVELHDALVDQLRAPGRLFIPVDDAPGAERQHIWTVDKDVDGLVSRKRLIAVRYVPLRDAPPE